MKRLLQFATAFAVLLCAGKAHAATCPISSGASFSTISATITGCASGNTVTFAAGTYSITGTINVPCGVNLTGPTTNWGNPGNQTAVLNFTPTNPFSFAACSTTRIIEYLALNGGLPSGAGGQVLYFANGQSNLTIYSNYFYGNNMATTGESFSAPLVYFDGGTSGTVNNNVTIQGNVFGQPTEAACSNLMNNYSYSGLSGDGGYCVGLGLHNNFTNLTVENNIFQFMEQGMKVFEGEGECVNCLIQYNDFSNIHRIAFETQSNTGPSLPVSMTIQFNDVHDQYGGNFGSWGISAANGCGSGCNTVTSDNVLIGNNVNVSGSYIPGAIEVWGSGSATQQNYNLIQGLWANPIDFSSEGGFVASNNTFCISGTVANTSPPAVTNAGGVYFGDETSNSQPNGPASGSGNSFTNSATCAQTSALPTISPASGSFSGSQTVTLTNPGGNRDSNTSVWYTTDGSTPAPGWAGTSQLYTGPFTVSSTTTVKAVGMWGAFNQPASYASGYGYVPSAVTSATYTSGSCSSVTSSMTTSQIQTAMSSCGGGHTLPFAAGTYSITSALTVPCGITLTGPVVAPTYVTQGESTTLVYTPTAILATTYTGSTLLTLSNCTTATTIEYLHTENTGGLFASGPINNLTVQYNRFDHLPGLGGGGQGNDEGIYFQGGHNTGTIGPNVVIQWNAFGDATSCLSPSTVMNASQADQGGLCGGVMGQGQTSGYTVSNNTFFHLEEGVKEVCDSTSGGDGNACADPSYSPPGNESPVVGITVTNNNFDQIHRIPGEFQPGWAYTWQDNVTQDFYNPNTLTFALSMACCVDLVTSGSNGEISNNNVVTNDIAWTNAFNLGYEWWGNGAQANNNLIQGEWACMICWGYGPNSTPKWEVENNTIQNDRSGIQFIGPEERQPAPSESGNVTSATYSKQTSAAPSISPAGGAVTYPVTVSLTDTGYTSSTPLPTGNTSIWYTTDGSTPVPNSGTSKLYAAPFQIASAATVKAVGMWGAGANTVSYTNANMGFAPSAVVSTTYLAGAQYFLSSTGSDSNSGTSTGSPWLSPNHALNCGDTITAAAGTYSSANFYNGKWGTVTCPANNNVAWLKCATFDACKISATSQQGMYVSASYWGISGWEITDSWTYGNCFYIQPTGTTNVHHVIFANDVANGCAGGGFVAYATSATAKVDYLAFIGDIAYGTGSSSAVCASGFSMGFLPQLDTAAGTHLYTAGSFAWNNVDNPGGSPPTCAGTAPTDGEGLIYDTLDEYNFTGQAVAENNIFVGNGGRGVLLNNNNASTPAPVVFSHNTLYGNNTQSGQAFPNDNAEVMVVEANGATVTGNLAMTAAGTTGGSAIYAATVSGTGESVTGNMFYSAAGNTTFGSGFGTNVTTTNPAFSSTTIPGAPSCSGTANVPACAATLIAHFTPTASGASAYGYQTPSSTSVVDPLFPAWLCNVNLPAGLVTPGCGTSGGGGTSTPTLLSGFQGNTGSVNSLTTSSAPIQQTAYGNYSAGTTPLSLPDAYGNTAVWSSSNTAILNVSSTGLISCVSAGTANSQVTSAPGGVRFNVWGWTCSGATLPTAATPVLSPGTESFSGVIGITITDSTPSSTIYYTIDGSVPTTSSRVYSAPISVSDTTTINAIAVASGYQNSTEASSTYTSTLIFYGVQQENFSGNAATMTDYPNFFSPDLIVVTAPLNVTGGAIYLGSGGTAGDKVDLLIVPATGWDTEASAPSCHATFTETTGTINAWVNFTFSGCVIGAGNYWLGFDTNDPGLGMATYTCNGTPGLTGTCLQGSGNYPSANYGAFYVAQTYGTYSGFTSTMTQVTVQQSQYIYGTLSSPTLTGGALSNARGLTSLAVGATAVPFAATGTYSDSIPRTLPDIYGNTAVWSSSNGAVLNVTSTGQASCLTTGTANVQVTSSPGSVSFTPYSMTCTTPVTPSSVSQANPGSVSVIQLGATPVQNHALCMYSDGVTLDCSTTDARGNAVTAWSAASGDVTIGAIGSGAPGIVTPREEGTTTTGCTVNGSISCSPYTWTVIFPPRTAMPFNGVTLSGVTTH